MPFGLFSATFCKNFLIFRPPTISDQGNFGEAWSELLGRKFGHLATAIAFEPELQPDLHLLNFEVKLHSTAVQD
jgi:hypothetical protein